MSARSWLVQWLLHSSVPCVVGLHMPVTTMEFVNERLVERARRCTACEKQLG